MEIEAIVRAFEDESVRPDRPPTLETIGLLYDLQDTVKMQAEQITRRAEELAELVYQANLMQLDIGVQDRARAEEAHA